MTRFRFVALDSEGRQRSGLVEADSAEVAWSKINGMGLTCQEVKPGDEKADAKKAKDKPKSKEKTKAKKKPKAKSSPPEGKPKSGVTMTRQRPSLPSLSSGSGRRLPTLGKVVAFDELAVFTRQLATLLKSGLPLLRALEVLSRQERRVRFREILETVAEQVRSGGHFSEGLAQHPKVFNRLYVNMVKAGEASGNLAEVLDGLARFMEKSVKTTSKVKSAMVYPVVVLSLAFLIVMGLMVFVIPIFEGIFAEILEGAPLPPPTRIIVATSNFMQAQWLWILVGMVALGFGASALRKTERGGRAWDGAAIGLPLFSTLVKKSAVARFARTFGTLLESGVPILEALKISGQIVSNRFYRDAIERIHDSVRDGQPLSEPMGREKVYPVLMTSMVEVGEETGALPEMLLRIADTYDEEVDNAVAGLTSVIEPFMIIFLAFTIGFIVIALFLPILEIMQSGFG